MIDLNEMAIFAEVAKTGSFTAAAASLGVPKSTVSRKVSNLEARLEARLLQRTTRSLSLTEVGEAYYAQVLVMMRAAREAESVANSLTSGPTGTLRITAPPLLGEVFLWDIAHEYMDLYPEVDVDLMLHMRLVDLVGEGFDLAIRVSRNEDSSLIARILGQTYLVCAASPEYLDTHGRPEHPRDLAHHECMSYAARSDAFEWTLRRGDGLDAETECVAVDGRLKVNSFDILRKAAVANRGIALLPRLMYTHEFESGALERILPEWNTPAAQVYALYPTRRHLSEKVRAFLDLLTERLRF